MIAVRLIIKGRVQGVGYRAWTRKMARDLGLMGWVRNKDDGTVEAWLEGPAEKIHQAMDLCRQGPNRAKVIDIEQYAVIPRPYHDFDTIN